MAEVVRLVLAAVVPSIMLGTIIWRMATRFAEIRQEVNDIIEVKVNERNAKLEQLQQRLEVKITEARLEAAQATRDLSNYKLEVATKYRPWNEIETMLDRRETQLEHKLLRLETIVDKLLGNAGTALRGLTQ